MNIPIEEKKREAVERMHMLNIFPQTIRHFEQDGYLSISEPPMGAFYWLEGDDLSPIQEFEKKYNALVYLVVRSYTEFGKMDSYLYVSDNAEEWQMDREDTLDRRPMTYTYNYDTPDFSEFGSIGIELTEAAGLRRIW